MHTWLMSKGWVEDIFCLNNKRVVIIAHSLGGLLMYIMLVEYCTQQWKEKYIDRLITVSAPFGGCSVSLKAVLSGYDKLPGTLKHRYKKAFKSATGIVYTFPNEHSYAMHETLFEDKDNGKAYKLGSDDIVPDIVPDVLHKVWQENANDYVASYLKNTGVPTTIVVATDDMAEHSYKYKDLRNSDVAEPISTSYKQGDTLIPHTSLSIHVQKGCLYSNYSYYEISNAEHTKILGDKRFLKMVYYLCGCS